MAGKPASWSSTSISAKHPITSPGHTRSPELEGASLGGAASTSRVAPAGPGSSTPAPPPGAPPLASSACTHAGGVAVQERLLWPATPQREHFRSAMGEA